VDATLDDLCIGLAFCDI